MVGQNQKDKNISAYHISHRIVNTKDHGIPQSRPRWYCVGILKSNHTTKTSGFNWPEAIEMTPMAHLLERSDEAPLPPSQLCETVRKNLAKAADLIKKKGHNPAQELYVVDVDADRPNSNAMLGISPCITHSRYRGHWITSCKRRLSIREMFKLQGMNPDELNVTGISPKDVGQKLETQ